MRDVNTSDQGVTPEARRAFEESFAIEFGSADPVDNGLLARAWRRIRASLLGGAPSPQRRYAVKNRTPFLIRVPHPDADFGDLVLPPFAQRIMSGDRLAPFEQPMRIHRQRHEVLVTHEDASGPASDSTWIVRWLLLALLCVAAYDLIAHGTLLHDNIYITGGVLLLVLAIVWFRARWKERRRLVRADRSAGEVGDTPSGSGGVYTDGNETAQSTRRLLTLVVVLAVGAALPTIAIISATDAHDFLVMNGGLRVKAGLESRLVSRVFQIIYTCVLALFPALLYFQFDRQRAGHIRGEWIRALFRMDGRLRTMADLGATYGDAMYEATGNSHDSVRGLGGKHSPIVVCTILIALGWTILVVRTESYDFSGATAVGKQVQVAEQEAERAADAAAQAAAATSPEEATSAAVDAVTAARAATAAQVATAEIVNVSNPTSEVEGDDVPDPPQMPDGVVPVEEAQAIALTAADVAEQAFQQAALDEARVQSTSFFQLLAPNPSAAGMAFLGAYFYGIYVILRSYFRGDLRSKIYNQITARLVTVVVVAYLINSIFVSTDEQQLVWVLSFLAGVVPTTVLDQVFSMVTATTQWALGDTRLASDRPLRHIDGIDIYDSGRLESEGVPDVAALATSDLSTLMVRTKLPIGRLVDWADQAVMMVVVGAPGPQLDPRVARLRTRGIRTGTDLLAAAEDGSIGELSACLQTPPNTPRGSVASRAWEAHKDRKAVKEQRAAGGPSTPATTPDSTVTSSDQDATAVAEAPINIAELCLAVRRQPVMSQILQWRSSPFGDVDGGWIDLPSFGTPPGPSRQYTGPLPTPPDRSARTAS